MANGRWLIQRVDDTQELPLPAQSSAHVEAEELATREHAIASLLQAFELLARRGSGGLPWAAPFRHDPIAFLLDTMSDAANLWSSGGRLLYQNRAAVELGVGGCNETPSQEFSARGRRFERRCSRCQAQGIAYTLELIREVQQPEQELAEDAA